MASNREDNASSGNTERQSTSHLRPIGFWSYSRRDDDLSNGKLSRLRAFLRSEIQQLYGRRNITFFQDREAIKPGADWEDEVRKALDESAFFIPIVTPNFIQSPWCCAEVIIFLQREQKILEASPGKSRRGRIFPIQWIDTDGIEPADQAALAALEARQQFDFRPMRLSNLEDEAVQRSLSIFASSICDLLKMHMRGQASRDPVSCQELSRGEENVVRPADSAVLGRPFRAAIGRLWRGVREKSRWQLGAGIGIALAVAIGVIAAIALLNVERTPLARSPSMAGADGRAETARGDDYFYGRGVPYDYRHAMAWYRRAAALNNADAQARIGELYSIGLGVRRDPALAMRWFRRAAAQGNPDAHLHLGSHYAHPALGEPDHRRADESFRQAMRGYLARAQTPSAQTGIGLLYEHGFGVEQDTLQALAWYRRAAARNFVDAQIALGDLYERWGEVRDYAQSVTWFRRAADQGSAEAQVRLGRMYSLGQGVPRDQFQAVAWYRKAAEQNYPPGLEALGDAYRSGAGVPQSRSPAGWYLRAANQGYVSSQVRLAQFYAESREVWRNPQQALRWYARAAEQGNTESMIALGDLCREGRGVPRNLELAMTWYRTAAAHRNAMAMTRIGDMYRTGTGVQRDVPQAARWYRRAAGRANHAAMYELALLLDAGTGGVPGDRQEALELMTQSAYLEPRARRWLAARRRAD